jgi:4-hydroxy-tetrahydrodipicolinate synthase
MFSGSYVALVTPFKDGKVDLAKLSELIEFHIANGTSGIVPCGTTGESSTLSHEEHEKVMETAVKVAGGKIKVVPGTGSNSTKEAVRLTKYAKEINTDGVLLISPYYNKPTQKGLYLHFKTIADEVNIPIMLYNIQSRTGVNIEPQTISRLTKDCKNIVAVKEASGSLDQMSKTKYLCPEIDMLSGDDALTLPLLSIGGCGVVSVVANLIPKDLAEMVSSYLKGDIEKAKKLHYKIYPLVKAMFIETNPIPLKTAMGLLGMCPPQMRLPMSAMDESNVVKLKKALIEYGLLKK